MGYHTYILDVIDLVSEEDQHGLLSLVDCATIHNDSWGCKQTKKVSNFFLIGKPSKYKLITKGFVTVTYWGRKITGSKPSYMIHFCPKPPDSSPNSLTCSWCLAKGNRNQRYLHAPFTSSFRVCLSQQCQEEKLLVPLPSYLSHLSSFPPFPTPPQLPLGNWNVTEKDFC